MQRENIRTTEQMLAYITDCTLATVADMASKKSWSKHEYKRQKTIAQIAIGWMDRNNIDMADTRARDIEKGPDGVDRWALQFEKLVPTSGTN